jgi:hypothetical protein
MSKEAHLALLRGMLSPTWQKPSAGKLERQIAELLKADCPKCGHSSGGDWSQCKGACPMPGSPHAKTLRQRLTALIVANTKLTAAADLIKDAMLDIESTGLLPGEFARTIATNVDGLITRVAAAIMVIEA